MKFRFPWSRRKSEPVIDWKAWPLAPQYGDSEKMVRVFRAIYGEDGYMLQLVQDRWFLRAEHELNEDQKMLLQDYAYPHYDDHGAPVVGDALPKDRTPPLPRKQSSLQVAPRQATSDRGPAAASSGNRDGGAANATPPNASAAAVLQEARNGTTTPQTSH